MLIKHIFFDMDDTLTDTDGYIKGVIKRVLSDCYDKSLAVKFDEWLDKGKTTLQLEDPFKHYSFKYGLKEGNFMLSADRSSLVWCNAWFTNLLKKLRDAGIQIHICTHRGWHPHGAEYTKRWLTGQGWMPYISDVIVLDSVTDPDKLSYLEGHYEDFVIVDDNPLHDLNTVHPKDDRIILCNAKANYPGYVNQTKINSLLDLETVLTERYGIEF